MPNAIDYKPDKRFFGLFVGRSGDGKSTALASFPKKLLDLDFDFRFAGIASAAKQGIISLDEIEYEQFNPRGGWDPIHNMNLQWDQWRMQGTFPYKTIGVESITSLTRLITLASHKEQKGKMIGKLRISGPGDFNFEAAGTHQFFDYLRIMPCNIIASAHIVDRYGKRPGASEYAPAEVIGEKLSIRDNLGENVLTYFDNVFRFSRSVSDGKTKYYVNFATDIAKNSYGIQPGEHDITGKNFYDYFTELIKEK